MTEPDTGPSWDVDRRSAPQRPSLTTNFTPDPPRARPRRVMVALWLVLAAALIFVVLTAIAGWRFGDVRDAVIAALPADLEEDYTDAEVRRAARVLIGALAGIGLVLTLVQVFTMRSITRRPNTSSRIVFVIAVILYLPVAGIGSSIRSLGRYDLPLTALAVLCLLAATALVCTRAVSHWWRQPERRDPMPLIAPQRPAAPDDGHGEGPAEDVSPR